MRYILLILCFASLSTQAVIHEKVLICGVCRDVEERLPHTIEIMERMGSLFEDHRILIYENNSQDGTARLLKAWARHNKNVLLNTETIEDCELEKWIINRKDDSQFFRPELIARARNRVLDTAMSDTFKEFTHVIWMDMDFKIAPDFDGIIEVFVSNREWDAVFAYGIDPDDEYWDWYAFRDATLPIGSELLGNKWWYMPKKFALEKTADWHPVYSAFGGCGIYKKSSIETCRYSGVVNEDLGYLAKRIISGGIRTAHPQVLAYLALSQAILANKSLSVAHSQLPRIEDPSVGIILDSSPDTPVWRMSSFVYQYPSTCEHVPFHACMIRRGKGKLFINPRMVFHYGG